jgi:hypothetical protein
MINITSFKPIPEHNQALFYPILLNRQNTVLAARGFVDTSPSESTKKTLVYLDNKYEE